jgi:hypothetical protein
MLAAVKVVGSSAALGAAKAEPLDNLTTTDGELTDMGDCLTAFNDFEIGAACGDLSDETKDVF